MADDPNTSEGTEGAGPEADAGGEEAKPALAINAQYIKDLSFEAPNAPAILAQMQQHQPQISININVRATPLQQSAYEVVLNVKADCKAGDEMAFIVELAYGGVFTINVPQEHVQPVLLIECPRLLFPFARNIIADATRDGGFPPLMLGPVDFVNMYRNQAQQQGEAEAPAGDA